MQLQAGLPLTRPLKCQLEHHFVMPEDPLSIAKLVFYQHMYDALSKDRVAVVPPVPSSNINLYDPYKRSLVRTDYYRSLLLDQAGPCVLLIRANEHSAPCNSPNVCRSTCSCRPPSVCTQRKCRRS